MECLIIAGVVAVIVAIALIPMAIHDYKIKRPYIDDSYLAG